MSRDGSRSYKVTVQRRGEEPKVSEGVSLIKGPRTGSVGMVRSSSSVRLSLDYNSVAVECGIEMPWLIQPGDLEAARKGIQRAEKLIDQEMERRIADSKLLLRSLRKK